MYADHICKAARAMAENMAEASLPMYGSRLRLPDRKAIIALLKEMRQLMFPAYFGDSALMTLEAKDYAALLLERIETNLTKQLSLALPGAETHRANEIARRVVEQLPQVQRQLLTDIDAIFDGDPAAQNREEVAFAYPGLFAIFAYRVAHLLYRCGCGRTLSSCGESWGRPQGREGVPRDRRRWRTGPDRRKRSPPCSAPQGRRRK